MPFGVLLDHLQNSPALRSGHHQVPLQHTNCRICLLPKRLQTRQSAKDGSRYLRTLNRSIGCRVTQNCSASSRRGDAFLSFLSGVLGGFLSGDLSSDFSSESCVSHHLGHREVHKRRCCHDDAKERRRSNKGKLPNPKSFRTTQNEILKS